MPTFHLTFPGDHRIEKIDQKTETIRDTVVLINTLGEMENEDLLNLVDEINEIPPGNAIEVFPDDSYLVGFRITRLQ